MPDVPGAADEPYDRRFVKWMIKNKVGGLRRALCVALRAGHGSRADREAKGPHSSPASATSPGAGLSPCQGWRAC